MNKMTQNGAPRRSKRPYRCAGAGCAGLTPCPTPAGFGDWCDAEISAALPGALRREV